MPYAHIVLAAVLVVGLVLALAAPAPAVSRPFESVLLGVAACGMYLLAIAVAIGASVEAGTLLVAPGVVVFCVSCWMSRGADRRDDGGGGGGDDDGPGPASPIDWGEFDRLRGGWERSIARPRVPVG